MKLNLVFHALKAKYLLETSVSRVGICRRFSKQIVQEVSPETSDAFKVFYYFKKANVCAIISRLKLFQTVFVCGMGPLAIYSYVQGNIKEEDKGKFLTFTAFGFVLAPTALYLLSFYSRRLIAIMWYSPTTNKVKIAHITFWGRRRDVLIHKDALPLIKKQEVGKYLTRLNVQNSSDYFFFTLSQTKINKKIFNDIFGMEALKEHALKQETQNRFTR